MTNLTGTRHGTDAPIGARPVSGHARPRGPAVTTLPVTVTGGHVTAVSTDTDPTVSTDTVTDTGTPVVTDTEPQRVSMSVTTGPTDPIEGLSDTDTGGTVTTMTMTTTPGEGRR